MKKLNLTLFATLAVVMLCSCSKEKMYYKYSDVKNLTSTITWYGKSGVDYTYEYFITIVDSPMSMGMRTTELLHACTFRKDTHTSKEATGTGTDRVYYQEPGAILSVWTNKEYKKLPFTWRYADEVLTIKYTVKDALIKDASYPIAWISENGISGKNGNEPQAKSLFLSDRSKVEKR